jgi:hypothetical protein
MPDSESNQPKFTERLSEAFKMLLALPVFVIGTLYVYSSEFWSKMREKL